ncbi:restriction endonuclease [Streptosporangium roseum]|uniref:restriction endonuclease n=1 Tax=Streptosporangium roseum TaxID=2001 RepID=UPI0033184E81
MTSAWDTPVGAHLSRNERKAKYGASIQGGILPSNQTPNVFVYSDPEVGETFGYNFDGWNEDRSIFLYTGEGRIGPQVMKRGNRAILHHRTQDRALRVFVADGMVPGTDQKNHRYIGEFEVDKDKPYFVEEAPDKEGNLRTVFVFRLRPIGEAFQRDSDLSGTGDVRKQTKSVLVAQEEHITPEFQRAPSTPGTALRRESELVSRYSKHLSERGHKVRRWQLFPAGGIRPLWTDIYDETIQELYEAKGTTTRDTIRLAIGQLFDYRRHLPEEIRNQVKLAVLLPSRPSDDLLDLLISLKISCIYSDSDDKFVRLSYPQ